MSPAIIVIPCYNEGRRIPLEEYRRFLITRTLHILFVNDGSSDNTQELLEGLRDQFPTKVRVLQLQHNLGKAGAVREGILRATRSERTHLVGFMDADLATPLRETRHILEVFRRREIEFVFGSRISRIGARINRFHYRHYLGRIIASCISIYLGLPVYDSQCGAKFFRAGLARQVFREPFVSRWLFDVEIFKRIEHTGRVIDSCALELPLNTWIEKGESKLGLRDLVKLPLEFCKIFVHYRGGKRIKTTDISCTEPATSTTTAQ